MKSTKWRKDDEEEELINPEVYFQCCVSPAEVLEVMLEIESCKWVQIGGVR